MSRSRVGVSGAGRPSSGGPELAFDPGSAWRLHPKVALRLEPFGALLYHYGTRRLSFVKDPRLAQALCRLGSSPSALRACRDAGVSDAALPAHLGAIARLVTSGMVVAAPRPVRVADEAARELPAAPRAPVSPRPLVEHFEGGLVAPICLTWELTYACNLACVHCLSSSGRRDPRELSAEAASRVVDELAELQVFYVNVGGGEPTLRPDFFDLLEHATARGVGVKFSTNGSRISEAVAERVARLDYVDVQVSLDGATPRVNDAVRGAGSFATALRALEALSGAGVEGLKVSVVVTRHNVDQLDELRALAERFGAQLRLTRLRPSGRGADSWESLRLRPAEQRQLYDWLLAAGEGVLTGDSFFHLGAFGAKLPGLNLCGAGRVVCLIDPVGDVYACPFAIHEAFLAGNVGDPGGLRAVWEGSECFRSLRAPERAGGCAGCDQAGVCRGGCVAAKFFQGLPLDGPDPECVRGHGEVAIRARPDVELPRSPADHSRWRRPGPSARGAERVELRRRLRAHAFDPRPCETSPLVGLEEPRLGP